MAPRAQRAVLSLNDYGDNSTLLAYLRDGEFSVDADNVAVLCSEREATMVRCPARVEDM